MDLYIQRGYIAMDFYVCLRKQCIHEQITGIPYWLCTECRNSDHKVKRDSSNLLIYEKILNYLNEINEQINDIQNLQKLKEYMTSIDWQFNKRCLGQLKATDFGQTEYYKKVIAHYNSMYEKSMTDIRDWIDLCELELDKTIFMEEENANHIDLHSELKEADYGQNKEENVQMVRPIKWDKQR